MKRRGIVWLGLAVLLILGTARWGGAVKQPVCSNPQSPRNVGPTAPAVECPTSRVSFEGSNPRTLQYIPRPGDPAQTLHYCGQHYHLPVENIQRQGEVTPRDQFLVPGRNPPLAKVGAIVEIHTAFAATVPPVCDDLEGTSCCGGQVVVLAWNAHVVEGGTGSIPARPPGTHELAEYSGSTTGPDQPEENGCKPAAQWSFARGQFTVGQEQLRTNFPRKGAQEARPLQTGDRLSCDLTIVKLTVKKK